LIAATALTAVISLSRAVRGPFHMPASCRSREYPAISATGKPVFQNDVDSRRHRNPPAGCFGLAKGNMNSAISDVLHAKSEAFLWT
jgi:hypothetical protein